MNYDVVIPCAPKDYLKVQYCVHSLVNLKPMPFHIYIVSKDRLNIPGTRWINEKEAIPIRLEDIQYRRPNWIYQQILKMTQDFTESDEYLCVDSDIIINKPLDIYTPNRLKHGNYNPNYFISNHWQHHKPYFDFMKIVWNLDKQVNFSFIADLTYFKKSILKELIPSSEWLLEECNKYLSDDCLIGEPEIYGNWLALHYPWWYNTVDIRVAMYGKYMPDLWTKAEIESTLAKEKNNNVDIVSLHSWT